VRLMSALPPKADIRRREHDVRFCAKSALNAGLYQRVQIDLLRGSDGFTCSDGVSKVQLGDGSGLALGLRRGCGLIFHPVRQISSGRIKDF
jgi:hypothetical protein